MNNKSLKNSFFINKEFYKINKFTFQIEKVYYIILKKFKLFFWNSKRNENIEYFKYFYKVVFGI